jgi:hypothetical protein
MNWRLYLYVRGIRKSFEDLYENYILYYSSIVHNVCNSMYSKNFLQDQSANCRHIWSVSENTEAELLITLIASGSLIHFLEMVRATSFQ